jgi:hypothetical protein
VSAAGAPWRLWGGVGAAFVMSLATVVSFLGDYAETARANPDPWAIARQVDRFASLRTSLDKPAVLGYFTDVPPGDDRSTVAFFAAAYSLAPHLVSDSKGAEQAELVVGHFRRRPDLAKLEKERGLKVVKDYGLGVVLFRREKN